MEPGRLEGRSPHVGPKGKANKLKQNVKNRVHIFTFSCQLLNLINTGAELGQYFCAYTIETQIEDSTVGLNPHNLPSGYIRGFFIVQTTWDLGDNYDKMHTSL